MAVYKLTDFTDIVTAVREELGIQPSDAAAIIKIKRAINIAYLMEIVPSQRWWWLNGHTEAVHPAYHGESTATVTPDSATVTLTVAPAASKGSFVGYKFAIDGFEEIYTISAHTANDTAVTLTSAYQGTTAGALSYKIWRDKIDLPTDSRETVEIYHERNRRPVKGIGLQELRKIAAENPKVEGMPFYYSTQDFFDPTSGTDETESDRYRQTLIHPSINTERVTIHIDYIKEADALEDDADEPLMPVEDRIVLLYAALARTWISLGRNPEEAMRNEQLYQRKLAAMAARIEDSFDMPTIAPKSRYLNRIRASRIRGKSSAFGGSSSYSFPTYLKDITVEGMTLTANMTVSPSVTIDGRDVSADGANLDTLLTLTGGIDTANRVVITDGSTLLDESVVTSTELTYLDNVEEEQTGVLINDNTTGGVAATWAAATYQSVIVFYEVTRGTNREVGMAMLTNDGTSAAIATNFAELAAVGLTLTADISGGDMRLLYDTTSTGTGATMKYKAHRFLT